MAREWFDYDFNFLADEQKGYFFMVPVRQDPVGGADLALPLASDHSPQDKTARLPRTAAEKGYAWTLIQYEKSRLENCRSFFRHLL